MADPSLALQEAIFARLQTEVSCPIYDGAPLNAAMPYVSIDREVSVNSSRSLAESAKRACCTCLSGPMPWARPR